jgi:hypothetical protein
MPEESWSFTDSAITKPLQLSALTFTFTAAARLGRRYV